MVTDSEYKEFETLLHKFHEVYRDADEEDAIDFETFSADNQLHHDTITEMVEEIYRRESVLSIPEYLDDIKFAFPNYEYIPRHEIYRDIIMPADANYFGDEEILALRRSRDNQWLMERAKDAGMDEPSELMYDLANRVGYVNIYMPNDYIVDDYSINLLWVNYMPQDRDTDVAEHIFGDGLSDDILNKFVSRLTEWRRLNPDAEINLWFDSALVTENAYLNTKSILDDIDVVLRDTRTIPDIPERIQLSLHPITQIYYRVDMLKVLITDHLFRENPRYIVVSDIDVVPMDAVKLFDKITMKRLDEYGYVFLNAGFDNFENSFFIFDSTRKDIQEAHRKYMIDTVDNDFKRMPDNPKYFLPIVSPYNYSSVYSNYYSFRRNTGEEHSAYDMPRKPVDVPPSQFDAGGGDRLSDDDYRLETFIFTTEGELPKIEYGERLNITWLRDWIPEPLNI